MPGIVDGWATGGDTAVCQHTVYGLTTQWFQPDGRTWRSCPSGLSRYFGGSPSRLGASERPAVTKQIESAEPTPPSEIADVPAALDEVLLRTLATEKPDRYETVIYLRDELQDLRDSS